MNNSQKTPETIKLRKTLHKNLNFTASEAYKLLRTNLIFSLPDEKKCRTVGITSAVRGEGKSTTAINLAYSLAETGKKVLLIDGDMRLPSIAKKLEMKETPGLSNILVGLSEFQITLYQAKVLDNWYILPAGDIPPNPSELLGSSQMENLLGTLSNNFDFIVIDLPPVNIVTDALAVSHLLDGVIVVVRQNYTDRKSMSSCLKQLKLSNSKILGITLTFSESGRKFYSKYRRYGKYSKYSKYSKYGKYYYRSGNKDTQPEQSEQK